MVSIKMKTGASIAIGIISGILVLVTLTAFIIPEMEANHQKECVYDGGKVTGFLKCTIIRMDYAVDSPTVFINLGATDPENENSVSPKEMTVVLGENSTLHGSIQTANYTLSILKNGQSVH